MFSKKLIYVVSSIFIMTTSAWANDIYITQSGDGLDLDINQDGQDNQFGNSTTGVTLTGDSMTFSVTQQGNFNTIAAVIKGNNYTGTWAFTGDNNTVDMLCDSVSGLNCEDVTLNITTTGDDNDFSFHIGEVADSDTLVANFTVTSDYSDYDVDIDGTNATITVVENNSTSLSTASVNGDEGNFVDIDVTGNGDILGNEINLTIIGGGSTYDISQSGIYDNKIVGSFTGDGQDVDITQSD
jgi:hypothetical protein|tara:strand:- start:7038 stop:7757 length:720 start_codon:yes stop_codon:yes gene_type:complete